MNFPSDNSTQTNTALSTTGTSYTYIDSNDLSTKQNVLNANTNLLGIGTMMLHQTEPAAYGMRGFARSS